MRAVSGTSGQQCRRIDGLVALADLEMELRLGYPARLADRPDRLALLDRRALGYRRAIKVRVGRDIAAGVADQNKIAHAPHFAADIGHAAVFGRLDGRAPGRGDVDAVIALAIGLVAEALQRVAAHWPVEPGGARG